MRRIYHVAVATLIAVVTGCTTKPAIDGKPSPLVSAKTTSASTDEAEPTQAPGEIKLTMVSAADLAHELAARKGSVVLLDMWATW